MDYAEKLGNAIRKDMEKEGKWMLIAFVVFVVIVAGYMVFIN